jgi:hypothetical protein
MAQSFILNNFSISAPATSPVYTVPVGGSVFAYSLSIVYPTSTANHLDIYMKKSKDGGATWIEIVRVICDGGTQAKGPNAGSPQTSTSAGAISDLVAGDQLKVEAVTVSGTWVLTATVTT